MTKTEIDNMMWNVQRELMQRHGVDASLRMMSPLAWYVNTGRASVEFLHKLHMVRPVLVARDLVKGGSDEEIINRICKRIGYQRC